LIALFPTTNRVHVNRKKSIKQTEVPSSTELINQLIYRKDFSIQFPL